jgi:hypothetical protein
MAKKSQPKSAGYKSFKPTAEDLKLITELEKVIGLGYSPDRKAGSSESGQRKGSQEVDSQIRSLRAPALNVTVYTWRGGRVAEGGGLLNRDL